MDINPVRYVIRKKNKFINGLKKITGMTTSEYKIQIKTQS